MVLRKVSPRLSAYRLRKERKESVMLVVSRKVNQSIRFANLGISVHVVRVNGNKVRIGIDAPPEVSVLRSELCQGESPGARELLHDADARKLRHDRRNQLNTAHVGLALAQKQLERGMVDAAQSTLASAIAGLRALDGQALDGQAPAGQALTRQSRVETPPAAVQTEPKKTKTASKKRALIVEDNDNERELLAGYLRLSGFQVDTASNGLEAIKYLSNTDDLPQAVVLDMKMPHLDGAKTVSDLRVQPKTRDLKLFAVSGSTPAEMEVSIGPNGVNRWLSKPVDPAALVQQIGAELNETEQGYVWPLGVTFVHDKSHSPATA